MLDLFLLINRRKNVPKSQRFISRSCHNRWPIWTCCQVKDPMWMADQSRYLFHVWVRPYVDLMLTVSMSWNNFMQSFTKCDIANLRPSIFFAKNLSSEYVTHLDHSVSCSASSCKQSMLVRRPGDGLDSGFMVRKLIENLSSRRPDNNLVVIATWS